MARAPKPSGRKAPAFESNVRRRASRREARRRLLVVCGGAATERDYLNGLKDHLRNPAVTVRTRTKVGSPSQLVDYAATARERSDEDFDEVWCVFDVDQFPDVEEAVRAARRSGVRTAVSNPCFEVWLLLHFDEHRRHTATYRELLPFLRKHLPHYDKARLNFDDYREAWPEAVPRARKLAETGEEHVVNPATGVWPLVERMAD